MSTTAQKLEYLGTTKSQLKDMINYGLDDNNKITNSTTFREYVGSIFNAFLETLRTPDTLFTNLPKKSGTGANITLNDTANAPMRIELGASELSQAGTPTPSSPQDIHTISGSNKVVVCGKNLLNFNKYIRTSSNITYNSQTDNSVSASGTNAWGSFVYFFANNEKNTDYTLSINTIEKGCVSHKSLQIVGNSTTSTSGSTTITSKDIGTLQLNTPTDAYVSFNSGEYDYIGLVFWNNYSATSLSTSSIWEINEAQIEKGNQPTTYEPYTSQEAQVNLGDIEYCKIGNYEDKFIRTSGKNLFDNNLSNSVGRVRCTATYTNGEIVVVASGSDCYFGENVAVGNTWSADKGQLIEVKPNTKYTWKITNSLFSKCLLVYYDSNKVSTKSSYLPYDSYTFTTDNDTKYISMRIGYGNSVNGTTYKLNVMINEGETATSYEPYGTNGWYIKKNIGKVVLDGSEEWVLRSDVSQDYGYYTFRNNDYVAGQLVTNSIGYSNYFEIVNTTVINKNNIRLIDTAHYGTTICIDGTIAQTGEQLQTWLSTHNTIVYYRLATPTYTQITGTLAEQLENVYQKMLSYGGQTNISQVNNDLSFNLSVQAIEDLN